MPSDDGQILRNLRSHPMTAADFRRIALSLEGWKSTPTHIRLAAASEDVLTGALRTAWKLRIDKNAKTSQKKPCGGAQPSNR
jgi:hypothetical protein